MYELYIANKNYSSWSLQALGADEGARHPVRGAAHPVRKPGGEPAGISEILAERQGAVPEGRRHHRLGLARHRRISERAARGRLAEGCDGTRVGAVGGGGDALGVRHAAQYLRHELRRAGEDAGDFAGAAGGHFARDASCGTTGCRSSAGRFWPGKDFTNADAMFCPVAYRVQSLRTARRRKVGGLCADARLRCRRCRSGTRRR